MSQFDDSGARMLTLEDLELFYAGNAGHPFMLQGDLLDIMKTAGTVSTSTTAVLNRVYGALIWAQLNQEANLFGILPKMTWIRSGWRVKTGFGQANDYGTGVNETGTVPTQVYPSIETVYATPKLHAESFDVTDVVEALANASGDDIWGAAHQMRAEMGTEFIKFMNKALTHKVAEIYSDANWVLNMLSIDRIISKSGEVGFSTGYETVYGLDRVTADAAWANSYVDDSASLRDLTDDLIRNLQMQVRKRGGNQTCWITGYETYAKILGLYSGYIRYIPAMTPTKVQFGVSGVKTAAGAEFGINASALYDIPLLQTVDAAKGSGTGEIPYLYALDTSDAEGYGLARLGISVLRPLEYFESRDYVLLNKFVIRGVYRFVGETVGRNLFAQGKLRDIK